jgi:hypothetical protein
MAGSWAAAAVLQYGVPARGESGEASGGRCSDRRAGGRARAAGPVGPSVRFRGVAAITDRSITGTEEGQEVAVRACPQARCGPGQAPFRAVGPRTARAAAGASAVARGRPTPCTAPGALGHSPCVPRAGLDGRVAPDPDSQASQAGLAQSRRSPARTGSRDGGLCFPPPIPPAICLSGQDHEPTHLVHPGLRNPL